MLRHFSPHWQGARRTLGFWSLPIAAAALLSLAADAGAEASFKGVGAAATGVSADGIVVVGTNEGSPFRWTEADGLINLDPGDRFPTESTATAASADGTVIVGNGAPDAEAFVWTAVGGIEVIDAGPDGELAVVDVSADGSFLAGSLRTPSGCDPTDLGCGPPVAVEAVRWAESDGLLGLGTLPVDVFNASRANGVSADGAALVGNSQFFVLINFTPRVRGWVLLDDTRAFRWTQAGGLQALTAPGTVSRAVGISADGTTVVGSVIVDPSSIFSTQAVQWIAGDGFAGPHPLGTFGVATDASADGGVIVGEGPLLNTAFLWREGAANLKTVLEILYGLDLAGWSLDAASAISDDGLTIVGRGFHHPSGDSRGWVARLDVLPEPDALRTLPAYSGEPLLNAVLPGSRSAVVGETVTAFTSVVHFGQIDAIGCRIAPADPTLPAEFSFAATDPSTNVVSGALNAPVDVPAGGSRSFVIALTPTAAFAPTAVSFVYDCANTAPLVGFGSVGTLLVSASDVPVSDLVAVSATLTGRGIAELDDTDASGVFAISAINLGTAGTVTARVVTDPFATLGIATMGFEICPTDPTTAACLAPAAPEVTLSFATNESRTFSVFMRADFPQDFTGDKRIFFNPRGNRAIVEFVDESGTVRGSTSVAFNSAAETPPL